MVGRARIRATAVGKHRRITAWYYTIAPAHMLREMAVTGNCGASSKDSFPPVRARHGAILASGVSVGAASWCSGTALKRRNPRCGAHRGHINGFAGP